MGFKTVGTTFRPILAIALIGGLAACASAPRKADGTGFETIMGRAEAQVVEAGVDAAMVSFEEATRVEPTRKEPWVRIAQLQFDQEHYARAIVAAEEVLQRDPEDLVADGVMTVASLRIASQSLSRLEGKGALSSETARKEAQALVDTLRSTMGPAILQAPKPKASARGRQGRSAAGARSGPVTPPAQRSTRSGSADPFQNLGN